MDPAWQVGYKQTYPKTPSFAHCKICSLRNDIIIKRKHFGVKSLYISGF